MDITELLDQLDAMVQQAKAMPLSSSVIINREELLGSIKEMKEAIPGEIQQARSIVRDRDELLAKAKEHAGAVVARGRQEQLRLAEQEEVVRRAHEEAARILSDGQDHARSLRIEAEAYADQKLEVLVGSLHEALRMVGETQTTLAQGLAQAEHGRERLLVPSGSITDQVPVPAPAPGPFDEEGLGT